MYAFSPPVPRNALNALLGGLRLSETKAIARLGRDARVQLTHSDDSKIWVIGGGRFKESAAPSAALHAAHALQLRIIVKPGLDGVDMRLIEALLTNARITNRALARLIDRSESACSARLRRLRRIGVIASYGAQIAFDRMGAFRTFADVVLIDDAPSTMRAFEHLLLEESEIVSADIMGGSAHLHLQVVTATFLRWEALYSRLMAHGSLVREIRPNPVFRSCRTSGRMPFSVSETAPLMVTD